MVSFDDGELEDVARGVGHDAPIFDADVFETAAGHYLAGNRFDDGVAHASGWKRKRFDGQRADVDGAQQRWVDGGRGVEEGRAVFRYEAPVEVDATRYGAPEVVADDEVRAIARGDGADAAQAEAERGIQGRELDGADRVEAEADSLADDSVDVAVGDEVGGGAVVGDEETARGGTVGDKREELGEVLLGGPFADHEVHAAAELFAPFLERRRLVVGVRAGGQIGVQRFVAETGRMTVDRAAGGGRQLVQDVRLRLEDAREVHDLAEADGAVDRAVGGYRRRRAPRRRSPATSRGRRMAP